VLQYLLVDYLVHDLDPLDHFLLRHTDVLLLQRYGAVRVVKEKEPLVDIDTKESGYVLVVGQGGAEGNEAYVLLGGLYVSDCPV